MGQITTDQSHQVIATLQSNVDWSKVDFESSGLQDFVIRNPTEAGRQFTAFLQNGCRVAVASFPTFKTIKLGTGLKTADDFRKAIADNGCRISNWANDILGQPAFTAATEETEVELVAVSVAEIGFKDGAIRAEIYQKAQQLGLSLCPPEVGPQLRLQYKDQLKSEWLRIAMEPITSSDGYLSVFVVVRYDGELWLDSYDGNPDDFWGACNRWVFVRCK